MLEENKILRQKILEKINHGRPPLECATRKNHQIKFTFTKRFRVNANKTTYKKKSPDSVKYWDAHRE